MSRAQVEITLRLGQYGERVETVAVVLDERLARELTEPVEYDESPFTAFLAGRDTVTARKRTFKVRRETAKALSAAMTEALVNVFGVDDELGGYKIRDMDPAELAYHRERGRIPG